MYARGRLSGHLTQRRAACAVLPGRPADLDHLFVSSCGRPPHPNRRVPSSGPPSAGWRGDLIVAQNGGGESQLSRDDNNYFSISYVNYPTQKNAANSLAHFVELVSTPPRYKDAWDERGDPDKFLGGLIKGGYIVPEPGYPVETWRRNFTNFRQQYNRATGAGSAF